MRILMVNYVDLPGRAFDGYDLMLELRKQGQDVRMIVMEKSSDSDYVRQLRTDWILANDLIESENACGVSNVWSPYAREIEESEEYQSADIVHFQILHNHMLSVLDYPRLMNKKKSVWTIHDPWIFTGNCLHPLQCQRWKTGCGGCKRLDEKPFPMRIDNTAFMWKLKEQTMKQINPNIVISSRFMENYIGESPMTDHWKKVTRIPFGIDIRKYPLVDKSIEKKHQGYSQKKKLICCRNSSASIKGTHLFVEALMDLKNKSAVQVVLFGGTERYNLDGIDVTYKGWLDEAEMIALLTASDIFVMPSLAESFGVLAIEAMAARCTVVSFEGTTVSDNTYAPTVGIAARAFSPKDCARCIDGLIENSNELELRGNKGRALVERDFTFERYTMRHLELYKKIFAEV